MSPLVSPRGNGFALSRDLTARQVPPASLAPLGRGTRKHSKAQLRKLGRSLEEFGFVLPILIDDKGRVVAGWGLVLASRHLGLATVPAVVVTDLTDAQLRSLRLALNRLQEDSDWDRPELALEFQDILEIESNFDLTLSGFEMGEVDVLFQADALDEEDDVPAVLHDQASTTRPGDVWILDPHRIVCGDALDPETYLRLLGEETAQMVITDPPYNVPIDGHVSGKGAVKHAEFREASGEMSSEEFTIFLSKAAGRAADHSADGSIHFIFMDWRHQAELLTAGRAVFAELKNVCVWNKSNAGMGSLYRSKHEFVFVFKKGKAPHINNVALGRHGRNRTNVWDYPSQNTLSASAKGKLALHPTVKPVALIADAIRDCSNLGGVILDPFGGAGTTLIAAERTGRRARLIEIEPRFVDVTIRRWQQLTGKIAVHAQTGDPYPADGRRSVGLDLVSSAANAGELRGDEHGQRIAAVKETNHDQTSF